MNLKKEIERNTRGVHKNTPTLKKNLCKETIKARRLNQKYFREKTT